VRLRLTAKFADIAVTNLTWVPVRSGAIVADPVDVMPLDVAVQQWLGLTMDARKEPRDVVVIDSAERPAPDYPSHKWGRRTEGGEAPGWLGATTENTGSI